MSVSNEVNSNYKIPNQKTGFIKCIRNLFPFDNNQSCKAGLCLHQILVMYPNDCFAESLMHHFHHKKAYPRTMIYQKNIGYYLFFRKNILRPLNLTHFSQYFSITLNNQKVPNILFRSAHHSFHFRFLSQ